MMVILLKQHGRHVGRLPRVAAQAQMDDELAGDVAERLEKMLSAFGVCGAFASCAAPARRQTGDWLSQ